MVKIILMFTSLLIQAYCISINEDEDTSVTPKARYNFNHPPTVVEYNPILDSIKHNDDSEYMPRKYREVGFFGDGLMTHASGSAIIVQNKAIIRKRRAGENGINLVAVTATNTTRFNNEGKRKSKGRKTKVLKRVIQQSIKDDNILTLNNVPKLSYNEATAPKPSGTTPKPINNSKASHEAPPIHVKEPRQRNPIVPIVESENYVYAHNGNFHYSYLGGDGTKASEQGQLKVFDDKSAGEAVVGSFSYTDKDGNDFSLTYTADENGYRPVGDHLPTPPPIPPAIARALQYLSTKTPTESTTKI